MLAAVPDHLGHERQVAAKCRADHVFDLPAGEGHVDPQLPPKRRIQARRERDLYESLLDDVLASLY